MNSVARDKWNTAYANQISKLSDFTFEEALPFAECADDCFLDGDDPIDAADEEMTYWGD